MWKSSIAEYVIGSMQTLLIIITGYYALQMDWSNFFVASQAALISFIPNVLFKYYNIFTPLLLRTGIVFFMFSTLILGEMQGFYDTYKWWDALLHGTAGIGLTLIGYILLLIFFRERNYTYTAVLTSFLAFSFTMAFAVLWEIYEFIIDLFYETNLPMQPSNTDTMTDLIVTLIGAAFVSFSGFRYLTWKERGIVGSLIEEGKIQNEKI